MKKELLHASSNRFLNVLNQIKLQLVLALVLLVSANQNTFAQCVGPFQYFESASSNATMLAEGWQGLSSTSSFNVVTSTPRSGTRSLFQGSATAAFANANIVTPQINTPARFTFYIRRNAASGTSTMSDTSYEVDISNDNGLTWTNITNGMPSVFGVTLTSAIIPPMVTNGSAWAKIIIAGNFPASSTPSPNNFYRFRIRDTRAGLTGFKYIDDIGIESTNALENTIYLPEYSPSVATGPCPYSIPTGKVCYFYDNGGNSDGYNNSHNNSLSFIPSSPTAKIKITYGDAINYFSTQATNDYLQIFNSDNYTSQVGGNVSGTPASTSYTSTAANGALSFRFVTDATTIANGFRIKVEAVDCSNPSAFAGAATYNQANLSWNGPASATQYEIFQSVTATPAPTGASSGTLTGSAATSYNVTGLTAGTTYYFWVRSICGSEQSSWVGPIAVTPICTPTTVPYLENFNGFTGPLPPCTSEETPSPPSWQTNIVNGNLFCNTTFTSFFTRGVTLTAGQLYRVSYDYSTNLNGQADLEVYYGTTDFAPSFATINTPLADHFSFSNIQSNIVNFTAPSSGTFYLNFYLTNLTNPVGGAMNLDNVKIEVETCLPPTVPVTLPTATTPSPYLTGVNDFGATLTWDTPITGVPANGYLYYVSTSQTPPPYLATASGTAATNNLVLTTLSPNTRYFVWMRADCGGQISTWSVNYITFVTTNITNPTTVLISDVEPFPGVSGGLVYGRGCNVNFLDSGGASANYQNNENHTYTFLPATGSPAGTKLKVVFNAFDTENNWDGLMIYSGDDSPGNTRQLMSSGRPVGFNATTCPAGAFSGTVSPGTIISNATNGSLSFTFKTDGSVVRAGWSATITCVTVPNITSFTPISNSCGTVNTVTINGTNFTGATNVLFGSLPAVSFTVNGAGTQIVATVPSTPNNFTGPIRVVNANAFADSNTAVLGYAYTLQTAPPTTTNATVCIGGTGAVTSPTVCSGYTNFTTTISGSLDNSATYPQAIRPNSSGNSTVCGFAAGNIRSYTQTNFQVSVSGIYVFVINTAGIPDTMGYITRTPFTPGTCSTNFVIGDDDGGPGLNPQMTVTLTAGVTYTLYTTTYGVTPAATFNFDWTITPPSGGGALLFQNSAVQWYTVATGGTSIFSGASFNPVGVAGSGVANNTTPVNVTYYAACSSNSTCRTPATFTIPNTTPGTASSNQTICLGAAAPLTLTGNGSPVTQWQYDVTSSAFGSPVNIPSSASTTLTSAQIGIFTGTRYYRAEITVGGCTSYSNVISITYSRTVWNGSVWSNGAPNSTTAAEFQGNYSSVGNLSACSVIVTSGNVVINTGHTMTVENTVTVSGGSLTFEDESSLYQPNPATNAVGFYNGGNTGNIVYKRTSTPMYKFDYTYWSTPVNPQNLQTVSPGSPAGNFFEYNHPSWVYLNPASTTMTVGKGYLIRAPLTFPVSPSPPIEFTASFTGVPNNGAISIPVVGGSSQLNLIGNPYPSAISAYPLTSGQPLTGFISANSNLNGSLYFWTHNTPITANNYSFGDYAIYNFTGGSAAAPNTGSGNNSVPTGIIGSGQAFFVEGLAGGTANFTNAMRRATGNAEFFRSNQQNTSIENHLEKHRYWINVSNNDTNGFKQVLIGYVESATNGLDRLFDAKMVDSNNSVIIYTKVDETKLTIQGKALAFDVNEQIPLCFKAVNSGSNFVISLADFDGLFLNQDIFIEDKILNVIHNLKESSYTFASNAGTFENRFILRYTSSALGVNQPIFNENSVIVYKNDEGVFINTGNVSMKNVTIYDVAGRLIANKTKVYNVITSFTNLPKAKQVLLVKIESENGLVVTKKVVN